MESGLTPGSVNGSMAGLRFFFRVTLGRTQALDYIPMAREPQCLPTVLSAEEPSVCWSTAPGLTWRAALSAAYGAGLRASEVVALKVGDICSEPMRIRVELGKWRRDRDALPSPQLLAMLREWWKVATPQVQLFCNRLSGFEHLTPRSPNRAVHVAALKAGIAKPVCVQTLRHRFDTHLLAHRVNVRAIQVLLDHKTLETWRFTPTSPPRRSTGSGARWTYGFEPAAGVLAGRAGAPGAGGRRRLPPPWTGLATRPCRPRQPGPAEGHVRDQGLQDR